MTVELVVPAAGIRLLAGPDTWGPRGLAVEALDGSRRVGLQRTFLLWQTTDDVPQTRVSVLAPVVGPPSATVRTEDGTTGPDEATVAQLDDLTRSGGRLRALSAVVATDPALGVAVDPALLDAAAAGTPSTRAWASALTDELRSHDVVALPWSDPDVAAAAHGQHPELVQLAVDRTDQTGIPGLTASSGLLWAPGTALPDRTTAAVTAQVAADGIVLPPVREQEDDERADETPGAATQVQTDAGPVTAFRPDAILTELFTDPESVEPGATTTTTIQRALAELAVITRETDEDQPHLLIAPGRAWEPDVPAVTDLVDALSDAPWVRLAPVDTLLDTTTPDARATLPTDADRRRRAGAGRRRRPGGTPASGPWPSPGSPASRTRCWTGSTPRSWRRCPSRGAPTRQAGTPWWRRSSPRSTRARPG